MSGQKSLLKEKVTISILTPILIYCFGYYLAEHMLNNVSATVYDCWAYILATIVLCSIFFVRRKDLEYSHFILFCVLFASTCIITGWNLGGLVIGGNARAYYWEKMLAGSLCGFYISYFCKQTSDGRKMTKLNKKQLINYCLFGLIAIGISIYPVSENIYSLSSHPFLIFLATCFFVSGILYPINILFSVYYKDKELLAYKEYWEK